MNEIPKDLNDWLIETRRHFHMHPEIRYEEVETTRFIAEVLTGLGLEVRLFDDMTGAVGLIRGQEGGRTLALRADIDALQVDEQSDVPYKSKNPGVMHACGHDAHATIMLGVAKNLCESGLAGSLKGNVKFLFQPAEEGGAGAQRMIDHGVLEDPEVDALMACHMLPDLEVGRIGVYEGRSHSSADTFELEIVGVGTHGGRPHQGYDPITAGAAWITAVQAIVSRNVDPLDSAVITVGRFQAGQASNAIPEKALLSGTIRAIGHGVRQLLMDRMQAVSRGVEAAYNVRCKLSLVEGYPEVINNSQISALLYNVGLDLLGPDKAAYMRPSTGAEDFAYFTRKKPGSIIRVGCGVPGGPFNPLHSPYFDIDERALGIGVRIFTEAVQRYLS